MAADAGIRELVADDQAIVRQGLEVILNSEPDLVVAGFATNGEEAVGRAAELRPYDGDEWLFDMAVLQELAQGKSNQEIVAMLFLAEGTVKNYVSTIMATLHANDRTQAAVYALKRGLARLE